VDTLPPPAAATSIRAAHAMPARPPESVSSRTAEQVAALGARLIGSLDSVLAGKHHTTEVTVATLLAGGNLLIEDVPGVGKTLLAQALARSVGGSFGRIQGTSDLLPGDITGSMLPTAQGHGMTFRKGPVFANIVVFDELNRATPRTQSALLEVAEESTVTIDGVSHRLPTPFMLIATQNPIEIAGTYGLGEGALDRFAAVVVPGRASAEHELDVLTGRRGRTMLAAIEPVVSLEEIEHTQRCVSGIHVTDELAAYVVSLLAATRDHPRVRLGASTRGGVALIGVARARAALQGRTFVVPDDIVAVAMAVLGHRVIMRDGSGATTAGTEVVGECMAAIRPPAV
jgi:MoxR-like ATPase